MIDIKKCLAMGLLLCCTSAWAQKTDGLIVTAPDTVQQFAISDVKELTFSDNGLTVVMTDNTTVEFAPNWHIHFAEIDQSGLSAIKVSDREATAQVFNTDGILVKEVRMADLRISDLPKGIYIINCNGTTLKIQR